MNDPRAVVRFDRPVLGTAAELGGRPRDLVRDPRVVQLATGHWARMPAD